MRIDIDNPKQLLSHFLLANEEVATLVATTHQWTEGGVITPQITFNGVEVPAETFEKCLQHFVDQVEEQVRDACNADAFEQRVEERAEEILEKHSGGALEIMQSLTETLERYDQILTPHWERGGRNKEPHDTTNKGGQTINQTTEASLARKEHEATKANDLTDTIPAFPKEAVTELLKLGSDEVQDALDRLAPHFHFGVVDYLDDLEMFYIQNSKNKTYGHNDLKHFLLSEMVLGGVTDSTKLATIIQDMQGETI